VAALVEGNCAMAARMADGLRAAGDEVGLEVLNDVVLNQVLVRFAARDGLGADERTRDVIRRVQEDGTCWLSGTTWHDMAAMRISISNWSTTAEDVDRSLEAILRVARG
jgi:glutamate/tyrosine decarboxylase-like PLP-dependent enzyme